MNRTIFKRSAKPVPLPVYEILIDPDEEGQAEVNAIALVGSPAIERNFLTFQKDHTKRPRPEKGKISFMEQKAKDKAEKRVQLAMLLKRPPQE